MTWNILSLYHTGACQNLIEVLEKNNVSIAALQEIKWTGTCQIRCGEYIIYFKRMESRHSFGTGFALHKDYETRVVKFNPISEQISSIRIRMTPIDLFIINIHSPIENSEEDVKESFYDKLTRLYSYAPGNVIKLIIGDANAKIGKKPYYVPTFEMESGHVVSNDNGRRLIAFALFRDLVISGTTFPHEKYIK